MTLDSITLTNFGLYGGRQEIQLRPPAPDKPVVLFGGLNGGGKTTFLDALQLVFFGSRAKTSSRGRLGYADYLSSCIHNKASERRAAIELTFRQFMDGIEYCYTLHRAWREDAQGRCREEFRVFKNDGPAPGLADNWVAQMENVLPYNIADLFFFDGEQIERYASPEEAGARVGTAIQNLLGLDLVEQLGKDIGVYERRKRAEHQGPDSREQLAREEEELHGLRERLGMVDQRRTVLRTKHIEPRRQEICAIEDEFRRLGGDLFERRQQIERTLDDAMLALQDGTEALRHFAGGSSPLLLVADVADSAAARDREEQDTECAMQVDQYLAERDELVLGRLRDEGVAESTLERLRDYLVTDRAANRAVADREAVLNLSPDGRAALGGFNLAQRDALAAQARSLLSRHARWLVNVEEARAVYDSLPDADTLEDIVKRREAAVEELARQEEQYAQMGREVERIQREIERREKSVSALIEVDARNHDRRDDRDRILRCSQKVRSTLGAFRREIISRHLSRIERLVLDSYQQLLRKTSLVTRLSIDPETFSLELYTGTGALLRAENLSAGERQLLGIAVLWGLAKASGRPLPTAIDTPLGRLDTSHRTHFVERYLPFASHQTLVFSTDEEIIGSYLERLRPWIGRIYHLKYDDDEEVTRVARGYFGTELK